MSASVSEASSAVAPLRVYTQPPAPVLGLTCGTWVEVRSKEEIVATLDANGDLDKLPFQPEMLQYCGTRFQVSKRGEKACDVIHKTGSRRMHNAVHLGDLRCDGSAHDDCQAGCLLFWKEAWLKPVDGPADPSVKFAPAPPSDAFLDGATRAPSPDPQDGQPIYRCQNTQMFVATEPMKWWDLRQYWRDLSCGNVTIGHMLRAALIAHLNILLIWLRRPVYPHIYGTPKKKTPSGSLGLQPGDLVQVRSKEEIVSTLNDQAKNRGLRFDVEMVRYCGGTYRVLRRVEKIVHEKSRKMIRMPNDCIILDGVTCVGDLSTNPNRLFCQRAIYPYWREIWLQRADG
jgi:hypothetical protein